MSKVLVTGGAGFIGSHVVEGYLSEGYQVVVIDNLSTGRQENLNPKAKFYKLDILDPQVEEIFAQEVPDFLNHHAAQVSVRNSVADPVSDARINILGSLNLFELSKKYKIKKIIFASTGGAIYGEQDYFPADEEHPLHPISPYGVAKLSVENYLHYYEQTYGMNYASLRYANVYGPRQDPFGEAGVVAIFTQKMLGDKQPIINGDGLQTRDFIYVADIVKANLLVTSSKQKGIFNLGTGRETSVIDLFDMLKKACGVNVKKVFGPMKAGEQKRSCLGWKKAEKALDWQPEKSLFEGLEETVQYFRKG